MKGTMMEYPLTLPHILERVGRLFGSVEIASRRPDKSLVRSNYSELRRRARALGEALLGAGLRRGDRVATLLWNHSTHLEAYFGVPCAGGVLHTLNLRLHPDELAFIANHAEDRFLLVDDVLHGAVRRTLRSETAMSAKTLLAVVTLETYLRQTSGRPSLPLV